MSLTDKMLAISKKKTSQRMYTCKYHANFGPMNAQTKQLWSTTSKKNVDDHLSEMQSLEGQKLPKGPYPFLHNGEWALLFCPYTEVGPVYTVAPDGMTLGCKIVEFQTGKVIPKCGVHLFKENVVAGGVVIRDVEPFMADALPSTQVASCIYNETANWPLYNTSFSIAGRERPNKLDTLSAVASKARTKGPVVHSSCQEERPKSHDKRRSKGTTTMFDAKGPKARRRSSSVAISIGPKPETPDYLDDPIQFVPVELPPPVPR